MSPYDPIAEFYDQYQGFQDSSLAEDWAEFLDSIYQEKTREFFGYTAKDKKEESLNLGVDLGCGTAHITWNLANKGWQMLGVDNSPEMLNLAWNQDFELGENPRPVFVLQDLNNLELDLQADLIYTSLDVFNHLSFDELQEVLRKVKKHLDKKGLLVFDLHSLEYMRDVLGQNSYHEVTEDRLILWQNNFSLTEMRNLADIVSFDLWEGNETELELYTRTDTSIVEYYHSPEKVLNLLKKLGFRSEVLQNNFFVDKWKNMRVFIVAANEN